MAISLKPQLSATVLSRGFITLSISGVRLCHEPQQHSVCMDFCSNIDLLHTHQSPQRQSVISSRQPLFLLPYLFITLLLFITSMVENTFFLYSFQHLLCALFEILR